MTLPKTKHPLFDATLPSNQKKVHYRQMIVSDEKILLMAKASDDESGINRAVKQVVNNCLMDSDVDNLTTFDIEYLFVKIRSSSIGNEIELGFKDAEDDKEYKFTVDLDKVEVKWPAGESGSMIKIDEKTALTMRFPPASLFDETLAAEYSKDAYEFIAAQCIDKIFEDDDIYECSDYTPEELLEWVKDLPIKPYNEIRNFLASTPHLFYEIEYTNEKGTARKIPLTTLTDFFTFV
jgi:hypothetical protein